MKTILRRSLARMGVRWVGREGSLGPARAALSLRASEDGSGEDGFASKRFVTASHQCVGEGETGRCRRER